MSRRFLVAQGALFMLIRSVLAFVIRIVIA
jgi:hypothetical protein